MVVRERFSYLKVFITRRCDLRCSYCRVARRDGDISSDLWPEMFRVLPTVTDYIDLFGGEPTLHPDLLDMVRFLADLNIRFCVGGTTSCQTPEYYANLGKAGLPLLVMSCDGLREVDCENKGSWTKSWRTMDRVPKLMDLDCGNMDVCVGVTISPSNIRQVLEIGEWFGRYGVHVAYNFVQYGVDRLLSAEGGTFPNDYLKDACGLVEELLEGDGKYGKLLDPPEVMRAMALCADLQKRWHCTVPMINILEDGSLMSCFDLPPRRLLGRMWWELKTSLEEIIRLAWEDQRRCEGCGWGCLMAAEAHAKGKISYGTGGFL